MKDKIKNLVWIPVVMVALLVFAIVAVTVDFSPRRPEGDMYTKTAPSEGGEDGGFDTEMSRTTGDRFYYTPKVSPSNSAVFTNKKILREFLPIFIENFETSVGIKTAINVYNLPDDSDEVIRLEIYGPNYNNIGEDIASNPDAIAFKESFEKAKDEIRLRGADPNQLYYIFGTRLYVKQTSEIWVRAMDLL